MDKKTCDVVVIGAGIGGLCLAARLSHAGYKTIVAERTPTLGGRYTWVDYKGYLVPVGAGCVWGGVKDPVYRTLQDVGIDPEAFEMKVVPPQKWRINGQDYEIRAEDGMWGVLGPACRDKQEEEKVAKALSRAFYWREPSDDITFMDWLRELTDNKTIHNIFHAICVMLVGPNAWEISAGDMFRYARPYIDVDAPMLLPKGGLTPIVDSLAKVVTDNGGEILKSTRVQRISVQDGNATGIEAKDFQIEAKAVVSNVGPKMTVELAGEQNFDEAYLKDVRDLKPWHGITYIIASNEPLYDWVGGLYTIDTRRPGIWADMTLIWPHWAPKGKHWMYFYQGTESATTHDPAKEYQVFLEDLAETFPRFKEQGGEILLVHHYSAEFPTLRAWPPAERHRRTPVENLHNVGDAVFPPGGYNGGSGAALSAKIVAEDIMSRIPV